MIGCRGPQPARALVSDERHGWKGTLWAETWRVECRERSISPHCCLVSVIY